MAPSRGTPPGETPRLSHLAFPGSYSFPLLPAGSTPSARFLPAHATNLVVCRVLWLRVRDIEAPAAASAPTHSGRPAHRTPGKEYPPMNGRRAILAMTMLFFIAGQAGAITISSIDGSWSNVIGGGA